MAVGVTGCGDGSEDFGDKPENMAVVVDPVTIPESDLPSDNREPEASGVDVLSEGIALSYATGNLTPEEEAAVTEHMKILHQNLEVDDYLGEAIHMVSSGEWFENMTPQFYEGCRSYSLMKDGTLLLSVQVGYDIEGKPYVNVCYQKEDEILLLKQAQGITWLLQTGVAEGKYEGAFDLWQFDTEAGEIRREQGTYNQGIVVGEYTQSVYDQAQGEAFDLWTNRENFEYEKTTTTYDEQGQPVPEATPTPEVTPTPKPTPKPTQKPAPTPTPKPTQKPTPTPEPDPTPEPEPDPTPEPEPDPTPEPEPDPTPVPTPTPEPTSPPDSGPSQGDNDVEWSPDDL